MPDLHRIVGVLIVLASIAHSIAHVITYIVQSPWRPGFGEATYLFVTGVVLLFLIIIIRIAARSAVYHSNYEVFFRVHVGGAVLAYGLLIIHGMHRGSLNSWKWVIGPVVIYVLDVIFRSLKQKRSFLLVSKHAAAFQGPDVLKIRLPRVFHFEAGQYAELKVPLISHWQWHPFTIASAPHEPEMVFYIKAVGDWTISLYQLFGERINGENREDIEVHIRGPYGAPAQHVGQFERVILVGGGVGATPFCSIVKDTHNWITNWTPRRQRQRNEEPRQTSPDRRGMASVPGGAVQTTQGSRSAMYDSRDYRRPVPLYSADRVEQRRQRDNVHESGSSSSHIFTTNVYSENFESLGVLEDITIPAPVFRDRPNTRENRKTLGDRSRNYHLPRGSPRNRASSSYTARDYLRNDDLSSASGNQSNIEFVETSFLEELEESEVDIIAHDGADDVMTSGLSNARVHPNFLRRSTRPVNADGMGSYYENSMGTFHRSLDYMTALHSLYDEPSTNHALYRRSLDLMVAMSFGSANLVRNMQRRKALVEMRRSVDRLPTTIGAEDLSLFHSNRVMFLLFMKSVTMNMILLWVLLVRYVVFGIAYIFGFIYILHEGIALYESQPLNAIDFALIVIITFLIAIPACIEAMELGLESTQGFDFFVVLPLVLVDAVVGGLSLAQAGENIPLFSLFRISIGWSLLSILILVRLFRVIGERVALAQNLAVDPYTTKEVDFYWTAPTPDDDRWLVKELRPYANVDAVRLHRYLTRCHKIDNQGNRTLLRNARFLYTNCGRPDWEEIVNEMADQCPNNSTIGVFFCGPRAMGEQVQQACMSAMRNSIVRGLHAGSDNMRELEEVFGDAIPVNQYTGELPRPEGRRKGGCNVKIVFKRETFS
ncbi:Ferredoxin-NADP reductase (FNR) nucleotide-binding [Gracilaria domingensis]|nr:Ferredoxin-NADP reductase (FNR) nucleotide-binding [Gracilaria domingensis]